MHNKQLELANSAEVKYLDELVKKYLDKNGLFPPGKSVPINIHSLTQILTAAQGKEVPLFSPIELSGNSG